MRTICLAGAESTGKSTLAAQLGAWLGAEVVAEYGRAYCAEHGTDISMAELVHIGERQQADIAAAQDRARASGAAWVIADTDALVTAVWADMMFGRRDPWFAGALVQADLHLVTDIDLPWQDDGQRVHGAGDARARFQALLLAELAARGARVALVSGTGEARLASARAAIRAHIGVAAITDAR